MAPVVLAERLKANLLTGAEGTVAGKAHSALAFAELLGLLNRQPADYDDAIEGSLDRHPDATIFRCFPGIGLRTAATLLAEISEDRGYYPDPRFPLAEAGQAPAIRLRLQPPRALPLRRQHPPRETVMWWSHNSLKESTWACDAYAAAHDRRQHKHGRARPRRPLATRPLRCWTDRVPYHPAVHLKDQTDEQTTT